MMTTRSLIVLLLPMKVLLHVLLLVLVMLAVHALLVVAVLLAELMLQMPLLLLLLLRKLFKMRHWTHILVAFAPCHFYGFRKACERNLCDVLLRRQAEFARAEGGASHGGVVELRQIVLARTEWGILLLDGT